MQVRNNRVSGVAGVAKSHSPDADFVQLLCSWVSEGKLNYLEGLGLSCEDIKMLKVISKRVGSCPKIKTRIFEGVIINKEAISALAKDAEQGDLLVEMVINGASYEMARFYFGVPRRTFRDLRCIHSESLKQWPARNVSEEAVKTVCRKTQREIGSGECFKVQVLSMLEATRTLQCPLREIWSVINKAQAKGVFCWRSPE